MEIVKDNVEDLVNQKVKDLRDKKYSDKLVIYLAAPFFSDEQIALVDKVKEFLESIDNVIVYSPKDDGGVLKFDATQLERDTIFLENKMGIYFSNLIVALIDFKDIGTVFEEGYGCALDVPICAVSLNPPKDFKFNVMLANSLSCFARDLDVLKEFVLALVKFHKDTIHIADSYKINKEKFDKELEEYKLFSKNRTKYFNDQNEKLSKEYNDMIQMNEERFEELKKFRDDTVYNGSIE